MLNKTEFMHRWSINDYQLRDFIKQGMPHTKQTHGKIHRYFFDIEECSKWYRQYAW